MSRQGEKIGEKTVVLKRAPSADNEQNVRNQIDVSDTGVEKGQEITVVAFESHGSTGWSDSWECEVYSSGLRITFPKEKIESGSLLPGDTVLFEFYERDEDLTESSKVIDRVTAPKENDCNDNVQSFLNSKKVYNYIEDCGGFSKLKLRNVRTNKTTIYPAKSMGSPENSHYRFNFPKGVRREILTKHGDLIEVITTNKNVENKLSQDEMVKDMYSMVAEMYDAYLENKNA